MYPQDLASQRVRPMRDLSQKLGGQLLRLSFGLHTHAHTDLKQCKNEYLCQKTENCEYWCVQREELGAQAKIKKRREKVERIERVVTQSSDVTYPACPGGEVSNQGEARDRVNQFRSHSPTGKCKNKNVITKR